MTKFILATLLALTFAGSALAVRGAPFITPAAAEDALYGSQWAQDNAVEDVACKGFGQTRQITARSAPQFKSFACGAEYSDVSDRDQPLTCTFNVTVRTLPAAGTASGIKIVGGDKPALCLLDPEYVDTGQ